MDPKTGNGAPSRPAHFAGHRRAPRHCCVMPIACTGSSGKYAARTLELSRSGVLLEMCDPAFGLEGESSLLVFSSRVLSEFSGGMRIAFATPKLSLAARVIRTARDPASTSLVVGCEFLAPLTDEQCRMLGLPTQESAD